MKKGLQHAELADRQLRVNQVPVDACCNRFRRPHELGADAQPIPGSDRVVFTLSPGHGRMEHAGHIAIVTGAAGPNASAALRLSLGWATTAQEIQQTELNVPANIANLEDAYKAFAGTAKTAETAISDPVIHAVPTYLEILQNDNSTQKIPLTSFSKMTATDAQTSIVLTSGALNFATDDIRKMVLSDGTASVPTVLAKAELSLYPNPATSYIVLHRPEAGQGTISIYSIAGQQVLTLEAGAQDMTIDVSALPQGVYIVKSGIHVAKFSKK